jgi:hypothetical protein
MILADGLRLVNENLTAVARLTLELFVEERATSTHSSYMRPRLYFMCRQSLCRRGSRALAAPRGMQWESVPTASGRRPNVGPKQPSVL